MRTCASESSERPEQQARPRRADRCWVTGGGGRTDSAFNTVKALNGGLLRQVGVTALGTYKCNHSLSTASPVEIARGAFCHDKRRGHALFIGRRFYGKPALAEAGISPAVGSASALSGECGWRSARRRPQGVLASNAEKPRRRLAQSSSSRLWRVGTRTLSPSEQATPQARVPSIGGSSTGNGPVKRQRRFPA